MAESPAAKQHFLLVLHDVAPETWTDYRDFVEGAPTSAQLSQKWEMQPRRKLPARTSVRARARLKSGKSDLGWSGGRAGG